MHVHRCDRYAFSMRLDNDEDDEDDEVVGSQLDWRYRRDVTIVVRRGRKRNGGTAGSIDGPTGVYDWNGGGWLWKKRRPEEARGPTWTTLLVRSGSRAQAREQPQSAENAERRTEH
ncbi:unnamed protein product [Lasius platythorax]|uniref:Uncharacterized protein n=2 Tax=Lasius platythorax TaxID=488582 RepID=A0AAV2NWQ7_9HYME